MVQKVSAFLPQLLFSVVTSKTVGLVQLEKEENYTSMYSMCIFAKNANAQKLFKVKIVSLLSNQ